MPPRFAYWTILIDNAPTAFRARDADELLPTLNQLKRKNSNVAMKWFARGRLWESPEAARAALRKPKTLERRGKPWRPPRLRPAQARESSSGATPTTGGGAPRAVKEAEHQDPRDRFRSRRDRPWSNKARGQSRGSRRDR